MLKKIFAGLFILSTLALAGIYLLIPANISIDDTVLISTTDAHVFQFLTHKDQWPKWWPGTSATLNTQYQYKNNLYSIQNASNDAITLTIGNPKLTLNTHLSFIATGADNVKVTWIGVKKTGLNPIDRFNTYRQTIRIRNDMNIVLQHLKQFLEDDKNVYHIDVKINRVKDPLILATKIVLPHYPQMAQVYELIAMLKQQIRQQHGVEADPPMLNVHQTDNSKYEVMVGIPITKTIETSGNTFINKMVLGNIMETRVKGGLNTVHDAFAQLENYKKDHHLTSPAMPFESLITDRTIEADTTKWITKIYYPIF